MINSDIASYADDNIPHCTDESLEEVNFKGCVCYIFASLFLKSKQEHLSN